MRRALVTGGRGFVGAWLCRALLERGVEVDELRPARPARAALDPGDARASRPTSTSGRATLTDRELLVGRSPSTGSTRSSTSPPRRSSAPSRPIPAAASRRTCAGPGPLLEACRERRGRARRLRLLRQGLRRPRRASLPRGLRPAPDRALRGVEGGRRPDRALLLAVVTGCPVAVTRFANIYGGGDLNFSRLVPEAVCAALDGPPAGPALRRHARSGTCSTSRTPPPPTWRSPTPSTATTSAARPSTPAASAPTRCSRSSRPIARLAGTGVEPEIRGEGNPAGEIDRQYVDATKIARALRLAAAGRPRGGHRADDRAGTAPTPKQGPADSARRERLSGAASRSAAPPTRPRTRRARPSAGAPGPSSASGPPRSPRRRSRGSDRRRLADVDPDPVADLAQGRARSRRPALRPRAPRSSPGRTTRCGTAGRRARPSSSPRSPPSRACAGGRRERR